MPALLIASHNLAKLVEYKMLLQGLPGERVTLRDLGITHRVVEEGASFEGNAVAKARAYYRLSHLLTLAEDSGLVVDALGGEPGVLSARYAGEGASDAQRIAYLLKRLEGIPWAQRTAHYHCALALASPDGHTELFDGHCHGLIALEPRGSHGFGYDPVFYLPELGKTVAELTLEEKNQISHRGKAARKAIPVLWQWAKETVAS